MPTDPAATVKTRSSRVRPAAGASKVAAPNKRAAQKAETRARLLESALALFDRPTYRAVSIEEVAAGAGLSRVGFYLHFASLAELGNELIRPSLAEISAHYQKLDEAEPTADNFRQWSRELMGLWRVNAARIRVGAYIIEVDPEMRSLWASQMDDVSTMMPAYVARWKPGAERNFGILRLTAMLLQHERLCYWSMSATDHHDPDAMVDLLSEQCWVLLCADSKMGIPTPAPRRLG